MTTTLPNFVTALGSKMTSFKKISALLLMLLICSLSFGQVTLISPTGDGGFETGTTFAANGWTSVASTNSFWEVGTVTTAYAGSRSVYVANTAGTYSYLNSVARTSHFYRDVVIPSGATSITLSFYWKGSGEAGWDRALIYTAPNSVTPVINVPSSSSTTISGATLVWTQPSVQSTLAYTLATVNLPNSLAGTTVRLIFTWQNDASGGTTPGAAIDNISLIYSPAAITSAQSGNWSSTSTWVGGVVPTASDNVVIANGHTVTLDTATYNTRNSGTTTTVNTGGTLATSVQYINNGTTTINGTFQLNAGGYTNSGNNFVYGAAGTLSFNNTSAYGVNNTDQYWPTTSGPFNVSVLQGGLTLNSGSNRTVAGTFQTASGVTQTSAVLTITGTCQINSGGYFNSAPTYGSASTLVYNATYGVGSEWTGNSTTAGVGIPQNVTIQNSATVTTPAGSSRGLAGNMNITAGTLSLGNDIYVGGNWTVGATSSQINNSKAVFFNGASGNQVVTKTGAGIVYFDYLIVNKLAGSVQFSSSPATSVVINTAIGDVIQILNSGTLDINGQSITLNNSGGTISTNGTARTITSTIAGATLNITNNKSVSGSGTLTIGANVTMVLTGGFDFGSSKTTVNGTLQLNTGGYANTNSPIYGASSTLVYNSVTGYGVSNEWTGNATTAGNGIPQNVTITSSSVNMPNATRGMAGNLTIGTGSIFALNGTVGADLNIAGNWANSGTFTPSSRLVTFNGTAAQTLTGATTFDYLTLNNSTGLTLANAVTVNQTLSLTSGKITLGTNNLTVASGGLISGGSSTSYVVTNGTGKLVKQGVGSTIINFPIGLNTTNYTPIAITNTTGTSDLSVNVGSTITYAVLDYTKIVNLQWGVTSSAATTATITPVWVSGNQAASFVNTGTGEIGNYTTSYTTYPVTLATTTTTNSGVALQNGNNLIVVGNSSAVKCAVISTFPWTENFDSMSTVGSLSFPTCWSSVNISGTNYPGTDNNVIVSATYGGPRSGTKFLYSKYTNTAWVFTPGFQLNGGTSYDFSFYMQNKSVTSPVTFTMDVAYGTTASAAGMTVTLQSAYSPTNSAYTLFTYTIVPSSTGTYYFGIKSTAANFTPWYLSFDDFKLNLTPSCLPPTLSATTSLTETTATINWGAASPTPSSGYNYEIRTSGAAGSGATGLTTSGSVGAGILTASISGLTAATSYSLYVQSNCGGSGTSAWSTAGTFVTACSVPNNPGTISVTSPSASGFTLNYAAASPVPTNYILFNTTGATNTSIPTLVNGTSYTNSTSYTFGGNSYSCITNASASPQVLTGGVSNTQYNYFLFSKNTTNTCSGAPYYSTGVTVSAITCPAAPTAPINSAITTSGATVSWTASVIGGGAGTINYTLEVYTGSGYTGPISGSPFSVGTSVSQSLTSLNSNTPYYYRIKANNGGMGCDSAYLTGTFTTACGATTSNAGTAQSSCGGTTPVTLAANTPSVGTGAWTVTSGPSTLVSQFSSTTNPTAVFTPAGGTGAYVLTWTITSGGCSSASTVTITVNPNPNTPTVTPASTSICPAVIQTLTAIGTTVSGNYINETFSSGTAWPTNWSGVIASGTDTVAITASNSAGGTANEITFSSNNGLSTTGLDRAIYGPFNTTGQTSLSLSWKNYLNHYSSSYSYYVKVQTSTDGVNWTDSGWGTNPVTSSIAAGTQTTTLTTNVGSSTLYISFTMGGLTFGANYWYIDNVVVTGATINANPVWTPITNLYSDSGATTAYVINTKATTVYFKSSTPGTYNYTTTSTLGSCSLTGATSVTVKTPVGITSATAAESPICATATTSLTANGVVGTNAVVTWYTGTGGTGTNLGTGTTITVGPGTYYARVTGDCGSAVEASVTVGAKVNVGITSATAAESSICATATTLLTANSVVGTNAVVTWYTGAGGTGTNLGTGTTLTVGPGTYYAQVTGDCGTPVEATVTVGSKVNVGITGISVSANPICSSTTATLTANGVVGTNAVVTWYTGSGGTGTNLGTGVTTTRGPGTYYARVTGDCGTAESNFTINAIAEPTWANLQWPPTGAICQSGSYTAYGQVYQAGVTDSAGQGSGITVQFGYNGTDTDPSTWTSWSAASYNVDYGNNDEYLYTFTPPSSGTFYYAFRYRQGSCNWIYGGYSAGGGGAWSGSNVSGILTVTASPTVSIASNNSPVCSGAASFSLTGTTDAVVTYNINGGTNATTTLTGGAATISVPNPFASQVLTLVSVANNGCTSSLSDTSTVSVIATTYDGTSWSNGNPDSSKLAIFTGNYTIAADLTACSLRVTNNAVVTVNSNYNVYLNGAITVDSGSSFTMNNNTNLLQSDASAVNTGNIIVKRNTSTIVRLDHTLWSSPVTGQNLFSFSPNTLVNRFYVYNTATNSYVTTGLSNTSLFTPAKGFAVRAPNNQSATTPAVWTGTFTGVPNNGTKTFTLATNAANGYNYNLVGNPYPSAISASNFYAANASKIGGTLYFYAHTLTMNASGIFPTGTNYATWTGLGGAAATAGDGHTPAVAPNGIIQVGQGFIVRATASGDVTFTNAMRVANQQNQFMKAATASAETHRMWLNLKTDTGVDVNQILVGYMDGATQGVDAGLDGLSFGNTGSYLYSKIENDNFVIQARSLPFDTTDEVPLGFNCATAGSYSISLTNTDGLFAGEQDILVRDNLTGTDTSIKTAPYVFTSEAGVFDSRFKLIYQQALGVPSTNFTENSVIVYKNTDWFHVTTKGIEMKDIMVYDISGRLIYSQKDINATTTVLNGLSTANQVLLLKITSQEGKVVTIKVIN
jgi:hypothetical protein